MHFSLRLTTTVTGLVHSPQARCLTINMRRRSRRMNAVFWLNVISMGTPDLTKETQAAPTKQDVDLVNISPRCFNTSLQPLKGHFRPALDSCYSPYRLSD